jgi:hypothetical protein
MKTLAAGLVLVRCTFSPVLTGHIIREEAIAPLFFKQARNENIRYQCGEKLTKPTSSPHNNTHNSISYSKGRKKGAYP